MTDSEKQTSFFGNLRKELEAYIGDRLLLLKIETAEKAAIITAMLTTLMLTTIIGFFAIFFVSLMLCLVMAEVLGSIYWGMGLVAGTYVILLGLVVFYRKKIQHWIIDRVIKIIFDKETKRGEAADE